MLVGRITPILEGTAMETGLGTKDLIDLRGGDHTKELLVVILMKTDLLEFEFIAPLDGLTTRGLVRGLVLAQLFHLLVDDTLFLLHLTIERKELSALLGREPCLLGDKLLEVGLEFLRREFLGLCSKKRGAQEPYST